jgi:hypothetical protein
MKSSDQLCQCGHIAQLPCPTYQLLMDARAVSITLEEDFIALEGLFLSFKYFYLTELICKLTRICFHTNIDYL